MNGIIEIPEQITRECVIAIGVSGGKDSDAAAIATMKALDDWGHIGPRVLIHADLGLTEWKDSLPNCQRLAERLGLELIVVRRKAGDMMERWEQRWRNNVERYRNLECVKLILPWSTPGMRFCTSELKSAPIAAELNKRFPGRLVISVTGVRAAESPARAKQPVIKKNPRLKNGLDWHPIHSWSTDYVFEYLRQQGFEIHEAYRVYGSSRVSCAFCIMSSAADLTSASKCEDNRELYVRMVDLEMMSTFSFQSGKWLCDVAPHLLDSATEMMIPHVKRRAAVRLEFEAKIPKDLEYEKGWPTRMPTEVESHVIGYVRRGVASAMYWDNPPLQFSDGPSVMARYRELINLKNNDQQKEFAI